MTARCQVERGEHRSITVATNQGRVVAAETSRTTEQTTNLTPAPPNLTEPQIIAPPETPKATRGGFGEFLQQLKAFGWRGWLLVAVMVGLYAPVLSRLVRQWYEDPDYSHGFLVPLLSAYLIWQRRDKLAEIVRKPSNWGLVVVAFALTLLFLGSLGAELFLTRVSIILMICGLIVYFSGWGLLRGMAFPLAFLLFAIPIPVLIYNEIVFPLQFIASRFATTILETLNLFPIMREGNVLIMPGMRLEVVEACSGIRSLMSLLALAAGYGYLAEKSVPVRWFLIVAMVPLAIVSNGTRVMITALMTNYIGPQAAEGFMHEFSGWVIFVVATVLFLALHSLTVVVRKNLGWMPKATEAAKA
jgi:exosortase